MNMEREKLERLLRVFTYRPGWTFEIWGDELVIQARVIDTDNHEKTALLSFVRSIPEFVRDDFDWARWLLHQVLVAEEHEAREFFKVDGVKVFDPHG